MWVLDISPSLTQLRPLSPISALKRNQLAFIAIEQIIQASSSPNKSEKAQTPLTASAHILLTGQK